MGPCECFRVGCGKEKDVCCFDHTSTAVSFYLPTSVTTAPCTTSSLTGPGLMGTASVVLGSGRRM